MTALNELPRELTDGMQQSLKVWADDGWPNAVIPAYADLDKDGKADYFGLTALGQLELLSDDQVQAVDETQEGYEGPAWVRT